jgi:NADH-quinone oxidoreductase subunit N
MTVGNLTALLQKDIKRLLAYSSIAQMGYMLIGLAGGTSYGLLGCFLHIFNHSMMKGLAFLASGALVERAGTRNIEEMRGLGRHMPLTTLALTISLLGLGGVPSTNGFVSKFILFSSVLAPNVNLWWLAVAGVLNSALSIAYYIPVIMTLIARGTTRYEGLREAPILMLIPMVIMSLIIIVLGVYPSPIVEFADGASKSLVENLQSYIKSIIWY